MNQVSLERLLMDRALGALPAEVAMLLDAYLEHDASAAARAREFKAATDLARRVLKDERVPELPPFPQAMLRRVEQGRRRLVLFRQVGSLAACVLIGVGLGAWAFSERGGSANLAGVAPTVEQGARAAPDMLPVAAGHDGDDFGGFWSVQRLLERAKHRKPSRPARVEWESLWIRPNVGGAT